MLLDDSGVFGANNGSLVSIEWGSIRSSLQFSIPTRYLLAHPRVCIQWREKDMNVLMACQLDRLTETRPKTLSDAASRLRNNSVSSFISMVSTAVVVLRRPDDHRFRTVLIHNRSYPIFPITRPLRCWFLLRPFKYNNNTHISAV